MIIEVKVKTNAKESLLRKEPDGHYLAQVKAVPEHGKANKELLRLIADHFKVPLASVSVKTGGGNKRKLISIEKA